MRIVVDLQACQSGSSIRGIGRYAGNLAEAMARQAGRHELWLALNGAYPDSIEPLRGRFDSWVPQDRIVVWDGPTPAMGGDPACIWRARASEVVREEFLCSLRPDCLHVASLFEGLWEDAAATVSQERTDFPTAVTVYDLIPYLFPQSYLFDTQQEDWYFRKLGQLRKAQLCLAISEYTRREAIDRLGLAEESVVNISAGVEARFRPIQLSEQQAEQMRRQHGITRPFVLYATASDFRKNTQGAIRAFALLPAEVRESHQFVVIGDVNATERQRLVRICQSLNLPSDAVVIVGSVSEESLIALYNLCKLFIFPSLHEGFGLPAVEAMACGAAVIAANTSCFPEIIGRPDALFDPQRADRIAEALHRALSDDAFRASLRTHGLAQAKRFTWEASARKALDAFDRLHAEAGSRTPVGSSAAPRGSRLPRLAYVSPLPPDQTGIADYSAKLLPALAAYYEIELISPQEQVSDPWLRSAFPIRSPGWFSSHAHRYDRVLYQMGNSTFHSHMVDLVAQHGGVVVLHDFFLSNLLAHLDSTGKAPGLWTRSLYVTHGYPGLRAKVELGEEWAIARRFHCNRMVVDHADGVIVHSEHARKLAEDEYGPDWVAQWRVVPSVSKILTAQHRVLARARLGLDDNDFLVCSFGILGPPKLNHLLIDAWLASPLASRLDSRLVFVGNSYHPDYHPRLAGKIEAVRPRTRIEITGFVNSDQYRTYLAAADVAVQLRADSRGETSAAVLDCMVHGITTIVNEHGSLTDLPEDAVVKLPDRFEVDELAQVLVRLQADRDWRRALGQRGAVHVRTHHAPARCAALYHAAIEDFAESRGRVNSRRIRDRLAQMELPVQPTTEDLGKLDEAIGWIRPAHPGQRQLLLDLSELAKVDLRTGIQRVVKSILSESVKLPNTAFRIEPVYGLAGSQYRYARRLTGELLGLPTDGLKDDRLTASQGDVYLGIDWSPVQMYAMQSYHQDLRNHGVAVYFVAYDLLPVLHSDKFPEPMKPMFENWLKAIGAISDGIVCISRAVADELIQWFDEHPPKRYRPLKVGYFHLGADLAARSSGNGKVQAEHGGPQAPRVHPRLLMVGTVEPRKGHAQTLAAFEVLWSEGVDIELVIVGKHGWMVDALCKRLRTHPELGKRLVWQASASDELLLDLYKTSSALLMASEGEGFGLPLIEAAQHGLPIITRDLPVFREVAGENAFYFDGLSPQALAGALRNWLELWKRGSAPTSEGIHPLTWRQSTEQLFKVVFDGNWYRELQPVTSSVRARTLAEKPTGVAQSKPVN